MELYTFIMDFRGGTYITQVNADSIENSIFSWIEQIEHELSEIKFIGHGTINELKLMISSGLIEKPSKLNTLFNVWYLEIYCKVGTLHLNIVKTMQ
jgi:hypothetical protein